MDRNLKVFLLFLCLCLCFLPSCTEQVLPSCEGDDCGEETPRVEFLSLASEENGEKSTEEYIDEEFGAILEEAEKVTEDALGEKSATLRLDDVFDAFADAMREGVRGTLSFFLFILGASLALVLLSLLFEGAVGEKGSLRASIGYALEIVFLFVGVTMLYPHIEASFSAVRSVSDLCEGMLPVFLSVNMLSGMEESALTSASAFGILLSVVEELIEKVALPALALLLATSLVPMEGGGVLSLGERLHKLYLSLLSILSVVIASVFALQTAITVSADRAVLRALRYGVGSMIPIVGQTVAGTLSALSGGVLYVKNTIGSGALVAIFALALPPLLRLLLCRLALSLPALFVSAFGEGESGVLSRLYATLRRILDTTMALVALSVALFVFAVILFMKSTASLV